jgi:predicted nucleotidyltransferase
MNLKNWNIFLTPNLKNDDGSPFGLKSSVFQDLCTIFKFFPEIDEVLIFGSRVKGNHKKGSDVDLTIKGNIDLNILTKIEVMIDDLFLPYTFDINIFDRLINIDLIDHINRVGKVIYTKEK